MYEFQIIPKFIITKKFNSMLVHELRKNNLNHLYFIYEKNFDKKVIDEFKHSCAEYEIYLHDIVVDKNILVETDFNLYLKDIKTAKPNCLVVFGNEYCVNVAKLINYISYNDEEINNLNDLCNKLTLKTEKNIPLYCVLNDFSLGSENNYIGVLDALINKQKQKLVFNANAISNIIYTHESLFSNYHEQKIKDDIFCMLIRLLDQYFGQVMFDWTKNYIVGNLSTIIEIVDKYHNNFLDPVCTKNLLWTNIAINNGLSSYLSTGDWKIHALAYQISKYLDFDLTHSLSLIVLKYLKIRINLDQKFKQLIIELNQALYKQNDVLSFINSIDKLLESLNIKIPVLDGNQKQVLIQNKDTIIQNILINMFNNSQEDISSQDELKNFFNEIIKEIINN